MKKILFFFFLLVYASISSAKQDPVKVKDDKLLSDSIFAGLKLRSIGPAFMSGRIADIVIVPENDNTWYVAVGSGGIWKTTSSGVTWKSVFDGQGSYSVGCLALDPQNPDVLWAGTGENVGGRHVGYGDGIYKSDDGGSSWKNMGLRNSEHLSKIIVHPDSSNILWVASQGPLWSAGGERGVYKTVDGGKSWIKVLGDEENTGATDLIIDPENPDRLYAATWQHHRTVASYMGGGPETAIYRSEDGGNTWTKLEKGLPKENMGKIGLAISSQDPDVVYAAIELNRRTGGIYRSANRGASWEKMSETVSGGTGPHYYQELYASPHAFDRLYLCDVRIQVSNDGGKTFTRMNEENKHSDNHAIAFRDDDPDYLLIGTDGGLYESFDLSRSWRYIDNLPVTQFYKVAVDDREPFYFVYGGTQDNSTQGGPSRTDNSTGIRNADWEVVLFADGHQPATEPGNPDIMYAEWQQGNLVRVDRTTGEIVHIQPQPGKGEPAERYNWDAPVLVSPHNPATLFYASQRVWKSENRGDSWTAISGDLTKNQERIELPVMGKQQSWDSPWDFLAMSSYNTITSLSESPVKKGLIYAGTDDGLICVTEDEGASWKKIELSTISGIPATAFVNDIKADLFDESVVYVALDNHKFGDFRPYLIKSTDKGKTWKSIASNIPDRTLVWRIVQDHVNPNLLFTGTEFGIYFTLDGGEKWIRIKGNAPTIAFRDLAIQRRENDLVGASFGRGFYILDDYSPLRNVSKEQLQKEALLFPVKEALWYIPRGIYGGEKKGSQGDGLYVADNPPFGAVITFYLKDELKSLKKIRQESEKKLQENANVPFPGWENLDKEKHQQEPALWLVIGDNDGNVVRKLKAPATNGFQRVAWDLRFPSVNPVNEKAEDEEKPGMLVMPGEYFVTLSKEVDGVITKLAGPEKINVKQLRKGALEGEPQNETLAFWKLITETQRAVNALSVSVNEALKKVKLMETSLKGASIDPGKMNQELHDLKMELIAMNTSLNGSSSRNEVGEPGPPTISERMSVVVFGNSYSTYGPTDTHRKTLDIAQEEFSELKNDFEVIASEKIPGLLKQLNESGAPWIEGMPVGGK